MSYVTLPEKRMLDNSIISSITVTEDSNLSITHIKYTHKVQKVHRKMEL